MTREADSPIIVTGAGRSGSTWMQWFLSQHPRIHIHGQPPMLRWHTLWHWSQTLIEQGEWARKANERVGYEIAHYAGSSADRAREVFRCCTRDFLCGFGPTKPRWGVKWIGLCEQLGAIGQFESLWPEARFVVCLRDPFATINSLKSTFVPDADIELCASKWVDACRFVESHDAQRVVAVQMDQLEKQSWPQRKAAMDRVMECIGEKACPETDEFLKRWPTVHKVTPDAKRTFQLSEEQKQTLLDEVPGLTHSMEQLNYQPFPRTSTGLRPACGGSGGS